MKEIIQSFLNIEANTDDFYGKTIESNSGERLYLDVSEYTKIGLVLKNNTDGEVRIFDMTLAYELVRNENQKFDTIDVDLSQVSDFTYEGGALKIPSDEQVVIHPDEVTELEKEFYVGVTTQISDTGSNGTYDLSFLGWK